MIKRVNSTGRRRIPRDRIAIEVLDGDPRTFNASIDLEHFDAPAAAEIVLEAKCAGSNHIPRFPWGTIGQPAPPDRRTLHGLNGKNVLFTLKVIDRTERFGRILGMAENIRPIKGGEKTAIGRRGILPVEPSDLLGDELWQLAFRSDDVYLLVNSQVAELADRIKFEPAVFALIYPIIVREVLQRALDEVEEREDDEDHWSMHWLRFAQGLCPGRDVPQGDIASDDERNDWIEDVVAVFCREHALRRKFCQSPSNTTWEELT